MAVLEKIRAASIEARKAKSPAAQLLTTVLSEMVDVGKNKGNRETTEGEAVAILKKFIGGCEEIIKLAGEHEGSFEHAISNAKLEISILTPYLPLQLTEDELRVEITALVDALEQKNLKQMGGVIKQLQTQFPGQFDGAVASQIIKSLLV